MDLPDINADSIEPFETAQSVPPESGDDERTPLLSDNSAGGNTFKAAHPNLNKYGRKVGLLRNGTFDTVDLAFESLNYERSSCKLKRDHDDQGESGPSPLFKSLLKWTLFMIIGALTGVTAIIVERSIHFITTYKYGYITQWFSVATKSSANLHISLLVAVGLNAGICFLAACLGMLSPVSCGSGIPHIKCYLNGVSIPMLLRVKTYLAKVAGVILSVSGGMPVGKEGPMIHAGSVIAAGVSQGDSTTFWWLPRLNWFDSFRNDAVKRDFVAGGAAAGVAAAFGAPVGGVLFAIEEGASYLDHTLILQVLMASMTSYFTLNLSAGGLISFGTFEDASYSLPQFMVFVVMGVIGGLGGALFNSLNAKLTRFRMRFVQGRYHKMAEVVSWSCVSTMIAFFSMIHIKDCKPVGREINEHQVQLYCKDGYFHAGAAIWFETAEASVKDFFHQPMNYYNVYNLSAYIITYFLLACYTYGLAMSSGIFIPSLLIGAAWGRLFGIGLHTQFPEFDWGDLGKYALIGASAQLSGIVRMTISLCAILTEATGNVTYAFPILTVVFVAKVVGDLFNEGLYDIHINLCGVPLLDWHPPKGSSSIVAKEVMASPVVCFTMRMRVKEVVKALTETRHHAFPIVDVVPDRPQQSVQSFGKLRGLVMRHDVCTMLRKGLFDDNMRLNPTWDMFSYHYPRYLDIHQVFINEPIQETAYLDFRYIMNPAVTSVQTFITLTSCFSLFRGVGLRHICVVNDSNEVVGMITRKDLYRVVAEGRKGLKRRTAIVRAQGKWSWWDDFKKMRQATTTLPHNQ